MVKAESILAKARSMLGRRTVYWAGVGGLDPASPTPARTLRMGDEWPRLSPADQALFRPLALQAGIDVDDPDARVQACDCTGLLCWSLGVSRRVPAGGRGAFADGWINSDSIWQDALHGGSLFRKIQKAQPGCVVVYPKAGSGEHFGHDGLVTEVDAMGVAARVIHCSASNFKSAPFDAIKENTPEAFLRQPATLYALYLGD